MIYRNEDAMPVNMMPGLLRRTLAVGESMMICQFDLDLGVVIPVHSHPHEQVGYVARGLVRLTVDGQSFDLGPGDCYSAPSWTEHGALALQPSVVVDTFHPPREDYRQL